MDDEREVDPEDLQHLKQCPWCTQSLKDLSDDDGLQLMANISSSKSQPIYSAEPEFTRLRSMLNSWPMDQKDEALGGD
ncbi:MAG: hypothetical protein IT423_21955 [Pirellulaceae bacterium]|nr:hypothetical protein [Pirellulaceae bacterium]